MLANDTSAPLTPAAAALGARIAKASTLRSALEALDQAFASARKNRILKAIRPAVDQCQQNLAPSSSTHSVQHISVRCAVAVIDPQRVMGSLGGPSRHDATFLDSSRLRYRRPRIPTRWCWPAGYGRTSGTRLCRKAGSPTTGENRPPSLCISGPAGSRRYVATCNGAPVRSERRRRQADLLVAEELYRRACVLDPHPDSFSQWMEWAARRPGQGAERVATALTQLEPQINPILRLIVRPDRSAFPTALGFLGKAERIDSLHLQVRGARLRLLAGNALRHLQQKKPALAAEDLAQMSALRTRNRETGTPSRGLAPRRKHRRGRERTCRRVSRRRRTDAGQ